MFERLRRYYMPPFREQLKELLKAEKMDPKEWKYVRHDADSVTFQDKQGNKTYIRR